MLLNLFATVRMCMEICTLLVYIVIHISFLLVFCCSGAKPYSYPFILCIKFNSSNNLICLFRLSHVGL
jgi:hypothetical protein